MHFSTTASRCTRSTKKKKKTERGRLEIDFYAVKSLNGSLTPTTRFSMCSKQKRKQPKGLFTKYHSLSVDFWCYHFGVGQEWLQNVFLSLSLSLTLSRFSFSFFSPCTNPISRWISRFLFMLRIHPRAFTSQKEKERRRRKKKTERNEFYALEKRQLKRRVRSDDDCDKRSWKN